MPAARWLWYQEWCNLVFMHMRVDAVWLKTLVPANLPIDTFEGTAWISVVTFDMLNIRPRIFPPFPPVSDFTEINVRTYVTIDGKPGVYFLSIEGNKWLSCFLAKSISALPYRFVPFTYNDHSIAAPNLSFDYKVGNEITEKSAFDLWVTERYCLYYAKGGHAYRYDIHHLQWPLCNVHMSDLQLHYPILKGIEKPERFHYSPGVQVIAWPAVRAT